ncbi:SpoIIE family protein phosphatase [Streptomyces flavalbus]|uniref:SpoIIE family protein phosphatase n=1 Tax=Streptomyces flavalbus TaxID=2665155 RepID=A0ABW2WKH8_9ACTN
MDAAFAETVRRTGASIGVLYLLDADRQLLRLEVLCGASIELAAPWARVSLTAPAPVADAVRQNRLIWLGGQEEIAHRYPRTAMALPYPLTMAAAPVSGVRHWGALLLLWSATRPPYMTGRERGHIMSRCRRLARLLEEAAERGLPRWSDAGPRVVAPAAARPDVSPALAVADFVERLPGGSCALDLEGHFTYVSSGACELLGRAAGELLGTLPWQSVRWLDDPLYEDRYRAAVISREPVSFTACRPPDQWLEFHLFPDSSGISVRLAPIGVLPRLLTAPRVTGTAGAGETGDTGDTGDTGNTGGAKGAEAATPARAGQLYQLVHLASALTEVVGVQDVIELIADQIMPAFGAQGLILSIADAGRLWITGHRGYTPEAVERLDGLTVDTEFTPAGRTLASGIPAFFASAAELSRIYPDAPAASGGKQAWAFLPLIISGKPIGCCVLSYDHPREFPAEERAVLTSLAGLIAQALDRARLYDTKHALAHGLQQALLPHVLPEVTGLRVAARYLPATRGMDIGGDFYDVIRLGDTAAAAVIGDVQGHNVAAAALMGQVRTAVHAHATVGTSPARVLAAANRLLTDLGVDLFTSCLYARLDFARGRVTLASAGHPPPLLRLPDGDTRPLVLPPGPLLGIDPDADFPVTEVPLAPGTLLALYTDGLVETPGVDLDDSIAALAEHLAHTGHEDLDLLIDDLLRKASAARQRTDDVALLVLHRESNP